MLFWKKLSLELTNIKVQSLRVRGTSVSRSEKTNPPPAPSRGEIVYYVKRTNVIKSCWTWFSIHCKLIFALITKFERLLPLSQWRNFINEPSLRWGTKMHYEPIVIAMRNEEAIFRFFDSVLKVTDNKSAMTVNSNNLLTSCWTWFSILSFLFFDF